MYISDSGHCTRKASPLELSPSGWEQLAGYFLFAWVAKRAQDGKPHGWKTCSTTELWGCPLRCLLLPVSAFPRR